MVKPAEVTAEIAEDTASVNAVLTVLRIARSLERIDAGVSPQQYRILKLIGKGGERSARLAEKLAVARPTLTSTADSLVAAGLAVREAELGDRRVVRLHLTPAGEAAVARADEAYSAWLDDLLGYTGRREEILADLALLGDSMTQRRRARASAEAGHEAHGDPAAGLESGATPGTVSAGQL